MHKKQWICAIVALTVLLGMLCFAGCRREDPTQPALDSKPAPTQDQTQSQIPTEPASKEPTEPAPEGPTAEVTDPTEPTQEPTNRETRPTEPENSSGAPTNAPTAAPTEPPTEEPTEVPTEVPTNAPSSQPTDPAVEPTEKPALVAEYEWYIKLSGEEQMEYMNSFPSVPDFVLWFNEAKAAYEAYNPDIEIGEGETIDISGKNGN